MQISPPTQPSEDVMFSRALNTEHLRPYYVSPSSRASVGLEHPLSSSLQLSEAGAGSFQSARAVGLILRHCPGRPLRGQYCSSGDHLRSGTNAGVCGGRSSCRFPLRGHSSRHGALTRPPGKSFDRPAAAAAVAAAPAPAPAGRRRRIRRLPMMCVSACLRGPPRWRHCPLTAVVIGRHCPGCCPSQPGAGVSRYEGPRRRGRRHHSDPAGELTGAARQTCRLKLRLRH